MPVVDWFRARHCPSGACASKVALRAVMTDAGVCVRPSLAVNELVDLLERHAIGGAPVVGGGRQVAFLEV